MNIKSNIEHVTKDRALMASWLLLVVICLVITILLVFRIHPSDLNTQVRYSAFGVTHIYSNAWYYLLPVVLFSLTTLVLHSLITIKLFNETNQYIARLFIWVTIAVVVIGAFIGSAVLGLASI
ncbi:MAG: hypothetical protein AAB395_00330 [Patescibacteria group bacterium]